MAQPRACLGHGRRQFAGRRASGACLLRATADIRCRDLRIGAHRRRHSRGGHARRTGVSPRGEGGLQGQCGRPRSPHRPGGTRGQRLRGRAFGRTTRCPWCRGHGCTTQQSRHCCLVRGSGRQPVEPGIVVGSRHRHRRSARQTSAGCSRHGAARRLTGCSGQHHSYIAGRGVLGPCRRRRPAYCRGSHLLS